MLRSGMIFYAIYTAFQPSHSCHPPPPRRLVQLLQTSHYKPRSGDRFGESVSLYENFLVVGCPGREDTWLHTGKVATDWEGEDVGGVYLYRRDSAEKAFSFFQVMWPINS